VAERLHDCPPTAPSDDALERLRHVTIQRVTRDLDRFKFNTAVAALMEFLNGLTRAVEEKTASKICCEAAIDTLVQLLHPMAPHITEEIWEMRGNGQSLLESDWPVLDEAKLQRQQFLLVVQVDGKLRDRIEVESAWGEKEVRRAVLLSPKVREHLGGREIEKFVFIPGRLVNVVTRKDMPA
jgi:leucyl-tRNA synthetase